MPRSNRALRNHRIGMLDISLVIPAYNEERFIGKCLDSVCNNPRSRFREIIVVDNGSSDATAKIAETYLSVTVVREYKKGANCARQKGFETATAECIAYIDADCMLSPDWFQKAEKYMADSDVVLLNGPITYYDGPRWLRVAVLSIQWTALPLSHLFITFLIGGNFIVRRSALKEVGGFNCDIAFYGDDADLATRLKGKGKMLFRMDFWVYTSARRLLREGIFATYCRYSVNSVWQTLFGRSFTHQYIDVR